MTSPLNFTPDAILEDAARMAALPMYAGTVDVVAPCALGAASAAAAALNRDADILVERQKRLADERNRICDSLHQGTTMYLRTIESSVEALNGTVGGGAGVPTAGSAAATPPPAPNLFFPHLPRRSPTPPKGPAGYSDVPTTEAAISAPDTGASLGAALVAWMGNSATLESASAGMPVAFTDWEGRAADAAAAAIRDLKAKLTALADDWKTLAGKGNGFLQAHAALTASHHGVYEQYVELKAAWQDAYSVQDWGALDAITEWLRQNQLASDEIRREYDQAGHLPPGPVPPISGDSSSRSGPGGSAAQRADAQPSSAGGTPAAAGSSAGGGQSAGMQPDSGDPGAAAAQTRPQNLGDEAGPSGQGPFTGSPPAGAPSGSPQAGGPPAGAGMPGGGAPGGRTASPPLGGKGAASGAAGTGGGKGAGGGGNGAGGGKGASGGKGAGGGIGGRQLSPAAVAVGPTPAANGAGAGPGTMDAGRAPVGAGAGGAGMPMMGHGTGHSQGKEKKRSPERSPDESIYTEDRPWTEGVVGHNRREVQGRREVPGRREMQGRQEPAGGHGSKDAP